MRVLWISVAILLVTACGTSGPVPLGESSATSVALFPTPPKILKKCERYPQLEPACPTRVPIVDDANFRRARASNSGENLWVFFAEWNAPHPGLTNKNAPPAFAHVNAIAGDVQMMAGFCIHQASESDPQEERVSGLSFGERTWNGRTGDEAANIAPLRDLDSLASTAAGQGIQIVSIFQDLAQISARYGGRAATVVNNHRAKVLLSGISDPATLEYAARLLGDEEVMNSSVTRGERGERSTTESTSYRSFAPAHVMRGVRPGRGVLVYGHLSPARLTLAKRGPVG